MNKLKTLCEKYGLSHRQLGILMGYHRDTIQKVRTGKYPMTARFAHILGNVTSCLKNGDIKIPK